MQCETTPGKVELSKVLAMYVGFCQLNKSELFLGLCFSFQGDDPLKQTAVATDKEEIIPCGLVRDFQFLGPHLFSLIIVMLLRCMK